MIGKSYQEFLTAEQQECLLSSIDICLDECFDTLTEFQERQDIEDTTIELDLPRRYIKKYDFIFLKKFVVCLSTVAWKLTQDNALAHPSCVAEELAAWMLIQQAETLLEMEELEDADDDPYGTFVDVFFEDTDFLYLYDDASDGIEDSPIGKKLGMTSLAFDDWFKPFRETEPVHPYVVD